MNLSKFSKRLFYVVFFLVLISSLFFLSLSSTATDILQKENIGKSDFSQSSQYIEHYAKLDIKLPWWDYVLFSLNLALLFYSINLLTSFYFKIKELEK